MSEQQVRHLVTGVTRQELEYLLETVRELAAQGRKFVITNSNVPAKMTVTKTTEGGQESIGLSEFFREVLEGGILEK